MAAVVKDLLHRKHKSHSAGSKSSEVPWHEPEEAERSRLLHAHSSHSLRQRPHTPPPKDLLGSSISLPLYQDLSTTSPSAGDALSIFGHDNLSRTGSVYSLSRISFSNQLSQLTELRIPDADILRSSVSAIPTANAAARTLQDAADQLQLWIKKADDVLNGLDAGDDIEWAAAAGRDGLSQIDQAISRFGNLVRVYIIAVEELQLRHDAANVHPVDMSRIAEQIDAVTEAWKGIKRNLDAVKLQVELGLDWQYLRDHTLGGIAAETEDLARTMYELEERRHERPYADEQPMDIGHIETIVRQGPTVHASDAPTSLQRTAHPNNEQDRPSSLVHREDEDLISLFARLQPLRTEIEFLRMHLSPFEAKAQAMFPSACTELQQARESLEKRWLQVEIDAESLRKELAEDKWNVVFHNANKQAQTMIKSVSNSLHQVNEAVESNVHLTHSPATKRKIEQYEMRKQHYCPAIERVLAILEQGVKDRLTVNGKILREERETRANWNGLRNEIKQMDSQLDEYTMHDGMTQLQLRDSISTILSENECQAPSTLLTPGTSPPLSRPTSRKDSLVEARPRNVLPISKTRQTSLKLSTQTQTPQQAKRYASLPLTDRKTLNSRTSKLNLKPPITPTSSSPLAPPSSARSSTPKPLPTTPNSTNLNKPRWGYQKTSGDYNVTDYYRSLMAKGKRHASSSAPHSSTSPLSPLHEGSQGLRTSSRATATPSRGAQTPTSTSTSNRTQLRSKRSEVSLSYRSSLSPVPTSSATTSMDHPATPGSAEKGHGRGSLIPVLSGRNTPLLGARGVGKRMSSLGRTDEVGG